MQDLHDEHFFLAEAAKSQLEIELSRDVAECYAASPDLCDACLVSRLCCTPVGPRGGNLHDSVTSALGYLTGLMTARTFQISFSCFHFSSNCCEGSLFECLRS